MLTKNEALYKSEVWRDRVYDLIAWDETLIEHTAGGLEDTSKRDRTRQDYTELFNKLDDAITAFYSKGYKAADDMINIITTGISFISYTSEEIFNDLFPYFELKSENAFDAINYEELYTRAFDNEEDKETSPIAMLTKEFEGKAEENKGMRELLLNQMRKVLMNNTLPLIFGDTVIESSNGIDIKVAGKKIYEDWGAKEIIEKLNLGVYIPSFVGE